MAVREHYISACCGCSSAPALTSLCCQAELEQLQQVTARNKPAEKEKEKEEKKGKAKAKDEERPSSRAAKKEAAAAAAAGKRGPVIKAL